MKKRTILFSLVFSMVVFGIGTFTFLSAQEGTKQEKQRIDVLKKGDLKGKDKKDIPPPTQEEIDDAVTPIVDYASLGAPVDGQRAIKNKRFNNLNFVRPNIAPQTFSVLKQGVNTYPDLPAKESDVIVEGKIADSKAFLSEDGTGIYSEFEIQISEVVKTSPNFSIKNKATLVADRVGGRVRYPSGKIVSYKFAGIGTPAKGKKYLLFLKDMGDGRLSILTAYALVGNKVESLDGSRVTGRSFGRSKYDKHNDQNINEFRQNVGKALRGENQ